MISFPKISPATLNFLTKFYPDCFRGNEILTVIEAMQVLKGYIVSKQKKGVTNLDLSLAEVSGFKFAYSYTRQNLHFSEQPQLHEIYPDLNSKKSPYYSSFHSSGQASISSLFLGLSQIWKNFSLQKPSRPYFETPLALKLINKGDEEAKGDPFLLIDSTSFEPKHLPKTLESLGQYEIAIIDTSLWLWSEPLLQNLIDKLENKINIFLVRSHLKLDCFGGEYSTLGSIVYLPSSETSDEKKAQIVEQIQFASSSIGACPSLDQIYPFYKNKEFHQITANRIHEIQSSMDRITPQLTPLVDTRKIEFEIPYHRLFIFLNFRSDNPELKKHILKFVRLDEGLVAMVDSYGFDFPTVLVTHVRNDETEYFIRINGHTLGESKDSEIIETLKKIIHVANTSARPSQ